MKKKLESELVSIAHRILKLKGREDVAKMHKEVSLLYEKLTVLKFAHENFESNLPFIGNDSSFFNVLNNAFSNKVNDTIEKENTQSKNLNETKSEPILTTVTDKIEEMAAFTPVETQGIENKPTESNLLESKVVETNFKKEPPVKQRELEDITAGFTNLPIFEPIAQSQNDAFTGKKSLNDRIKIGGLHIGLNDKIAFIKHLFDGKSEDYDRVLSQLNTFESYSIAKNFIDTIVKPDYNNWEGKNEFEERFVQIIEAKFN